MRNKLLILLAFTALSCCPKPLTVVSDGIVTEVQAYSPTIVRVFKYAEGQRPEKLSIPVIMKPERNVAKITRFDDRIELTTDSLKVCVLLASGEVSFYDSASKTLVRENACSVKELKQSFLLESDEAIYGLGQQQEGRMSQRNQELRLLQENMKIAIPFVHSVKGYGLYWDNYSPTLFIDNEGGMSFSSEAGAGCDYYFLYGGNADGVISQVRQLTGKASMFPLWALGFFQSRERYESQEQIVGIVRQYRELGLPLDCIVQDWQYWGDNLNWNAMRFDNPQFSDPDKMVRQIHDLNAKIMISVWPSFGPESDIHKELAAKDLLYNYDTHPSNGNHIYDAFNPEAREIYWKYLKEGLLSKNIDAWWLDGTEPENVKGVPYALDNMTYLGPLREYHNAFPLVTNMGVYEHLRLEDSTRRPFLMTRSGFLGQQHYGSLSWSGDVVARWDVLRKQISAGLNYSLCGIPFWNSDIGGFFAWSYNNDQHNKAYHELHTRWFQFGTFCPIMRSHNSSPVRPEIFMFGSEGDWAYDAQAKFLKLRYSLLPYLYSNAYDVYQNDGTLMRHLMMDYAFDKNVHNIDDQYFFGRGLMVKIVTEPMYTQAWGENNQFWKEDFSSLKSTSVYLPDGNSWWDFWTNIEFSGGQTISREVPIDIIPIYVPGGTILPIGPDVQYSSQKPWDELEIRIYPGADGKFVLYEDEGDGLGYERGVGSTIEFAWNEASRELSISNIKGSYPGMIKDRSFNIVVVDTSEQTKISYTGKEQKIKL